MRFEAVALAGLCVGACISNTDGLPCSVTTQPSASLGGMQITLDTPSCTMQSGTGALLDYTIVTTSAIAFQYGPHGACIPTSTSDPSSFVTAEVTGSGGEYCPTCDVGTCNEDQGEPVMIPAATYQGSLNFLGRQWDGPAGSGVPVGGPLPAGAYTARVLVSMPVGQAEADLTVTLD